MVEQFQHSPLDQDSDAIRLLHVLPTLSPTGLIQCKLQHENTSAAYFGLSYEWGGEGDERDILINGRAFRVRRNLWDFLDILRNNSESANRALETPFWIDAISIDQRNLGERNHQVRLMGQIYSSAAQVWVWLGIKGALSPRLATLFDLDPDDDDADSFRRRSPLEYARKTLGKLRPLGEEWLDDLEAVYHSTYWSRLWIVQECHLAKSLVYVFGQCVVSEHSFHCATTEVVNPIYLFPPKPFQAGLRATAFWKIHEQRWINKDDKRWKSQQDLEKLIVRYQKAACQDWHDRVFGFVSLVPSGENLKIDYALSRAGLLLMAVRFAFAAKEDAQELGIFYSLLRELLGATDGEILNEEPLLPLEVSGYRHLNDIPVALGEHLTFFDASDHVVAHLREWSDARAPYFKDEETANWINEMGQGAYMSRFMGKLKTARLEGGDCLIERCACPKCHSLPNLREGDRIITLAVPTSVKDSETWSRVVLLARGFDEPTSYSMEVIGAVSRVSDTIEGVPTYQRSQNHGDKFSSSSRLIYHVIPGTGISDLQRSIHRSLETQSPDRIEVAPPSDEIFKVWITMDLPLLTFMVNSIIFETDKPPRWRHKVEICRKDQ